MTAVVKVAEALRLAHEWQPWINCFVSIDDNNAIEEAERTDAIGLPENNSILVGLPIAYKDVFLRSNRRPQAGSQVLLDEMIGSPADVAQALRLAGTIDIGSLHLDEFSYAATGRNDTLGDCKNPWDLTRATGGSSSGAAAAVAARIVKLAIATDTGGSARIPAAWCGVLGFKPTFSAVSTTGVVPLSHSHDTVALLGMDVQILREAYLALVSWKSPISPGTIEQALPLSGLRVGRLDMSAMRGVDQDVLSGLGIASDAFTELGAAIEDVELPYLDQCNSAAAVITASEASALHGGLLRGQADRYQVGTRTRLRVGQFLSAIDYIDAMRYRAHAIRSALTLSFAESDVIMTPVASSVAPRLAELPSSSNPRIAQDTGSLLVYTRPFNFLGFPSLSVPVGFTPNGLPTAVQLIAAPWADERLLDVASALEGIINWSRQHPRLPTHAGQSRRDIQ